MAKIRKDHIATGGGPRDSIELTDEEQRLLSIIGQANVEGLDVPEAGIKMPIASSVPSSSVPASSSSSQEIITIIEELSDEEEENFVSIY